MFYNNLNNVRIMNAFYHNFFYIQYLYGEGIFINFYIIFFYINLIGYCKNKYLNILK